MKLQRGEKKLAAICALALAVPLGVAAFFGHINATPIIPATPPVKMPVPNGYDLYVRASNAIKPANPAVDYNLDLKPPTDPKIRAQRYSLKRKDAWLAKNKTGFARFKEAQKADSLAPPYSAKSQGREIRQMARYKVIESNAHWQRGDFDAALQSGLDIAQLGYDVQRGGAFMDYVTGTAIGQLASRATGDTVEFVSAPTAKSGARRLERLLATRWTLKESLREENARARQDWLLYFQNPGWRTDFVRLQEWSTATWGSEPLTWKEHWLIRVTSKRQILADLDNFHARIAVRTPYVSGGQAQITVDNPFIDKTYSYLARKPFNEASVLTADRVLMLRLALRAHQLEHDAPPPNLQSLVPNYLRAVPADPFGKGAPLRYKTDGKTYSLWSIGPDGKDDGGAPIPWFNPKRKRTIYADEREKLPWIDYGSIGDYVAGRNH